jgi:hypothetical protein
MHANIIDLFAKGNQELFHSSFIAWLLDENGSHGLGRRFLNAFATLLAPEVAARLNGPLAVHTESTLGRSRFDILLSPKVPEATEHRGVVLENKTKSFGTAIQLGKYREQGFAVVALVLLPETLDDESHKSFPVVHYAQIRDLLKSLTLESGNHYHFLIAQYAQHLTDTLAVFESLDKYCRGDVPSSQFREMLKELPAAVSARDNDIRTFTYYYYHSLARHITSAERDLVFGTLGYEGAEQQKENTRWLYEKNMQGPPFMEALIHRPADMRSWRLQDPLRDIAEQHNAVIAPRVEVWLDMGRIADDPDADLEIGHLVLGTWTSELQQILRTRQPYASSLRRRPKAKRNFHCEPLRISDLPYARASDRIRGALRLVFDRAD